MRELRLRRIVAIGMTDYRLIQLAASCAQGSARSIARATVMRAQFHALPLLEAVTHEHTNGFSALINDRRVEIGTLSYIRAKKIPFQYAMGILKGLVKSGYIVRFVAVSGRLAGILGYEEKPDF